MKCIDTQCINYNKAIDNCCNVYSDHDIEKSYCYIPEKSCNNCGWNRLDDGISVQCTHPEHMINCINCSNWKPEENKIKKPLFDNKKDAEYFYNKIVYENYSGLNKFIERCNDNGYIKKSELEIAKDEYIKLACGSVTTKRYNALLRYSRELEKEIERLKGE